MSKQPCRKCQLIRVVVFAIVLGGGAGYWAAISGLGMQVSMVVTFIGAMIPVMWFAKRKSG